MTLKHMRRQGFGHLGAFDAMYQQTAVHRMVVRATTGNAEKRFRDCLAGEQSMRKRAYFTVLQSVEQANQAFERIECIRWHPASRQQMPAGLIELVHGRGTRHVDV
jgi:uncharacterized protein (DUF2236 family)